MNIYNCKLCNTLLFEPNGMNKIKKVFYLVSNLQVLQKENHITDKKLH